MKSVLAPLLFKVLSLALRKRRARFERALTNPRLAQTRAFQEILRLASATKYGQIRALDEKTSLAEFRRRVPIVTYDDIESWIAKERAGDAGVIAPEEVLFFEPTSGSSGSRKWIPYTQRLKSSFHNMFLLWLEDLITNGPRLRIGSAWMSVSLAPEAVTGLKDDSEYLCGAWSWLLRRFLAVPSDIRNLKDENTFCHVLSVCLIARADLEVVSIWNPSLFRMVMTYIETNRDRVIADARRGRLQAEGQTFLFPRLSETRSALFREKEIDWSAVWPDLRLISCWGGAHASSFVAPLRRKFPNAMVQEKGLLATEAPLTIPWIRAGSFVPLVDEVFFEFEDSQGRLHLLDGVSEGESYQVIFSQKGGLLRYRIGDVVKVTGRYLGSPLLEFTGRADAVSDVVGEKLHETFVASALNSVELGAGSFLCLFPFQDSNGWRYILAGENLSADAATKADEALQENFHYAVARRQGQLLAVVSIDCVQIQQVLQAVLVERGMKLGDIKPNALIRNVDVGRRVMEVLASIQPFRLTEAHEAESRA